MWLVHLSHVIVGFIEERTVDRSSDVYLPYLGTLGTAAGGYHG